MYSFAHAGDLGDLIYGLAAMRNIGRGELFLSERTAHVGFQPRQGISQANYIRLQPLLGPQPYIHSVRWTSSPPFAEHDLNKFRFYWKRSYPWLAPKCHLLDMHFACVDRATVWEPWLEAPAVREADVVIARSPRQHNCRFPWRRVVKKYEGRSLFVGLPEEHSAFEKFVGARVPFREVAHFWDLAALINGAQLFVGNSSFPLALATAMHKPIVQEISLQSVDDAHTALPIGWGINGRDEDVSLPDV